MKTRTILIMFLLGYSVIADSSEETQRNREHSAIVHDFNSANFFDPKRHCLFNNAIYTIGSKLKIADKLHQCTYKQGVGGELEGAQWDISWVGKLHYYKEETIETERH